MNNEMSEIATAIEAIFSTTKETINHGAVVALTSRTEKEFGIYCENLARDSHQKAYFRCETCKEEFVREWRLQHQKHTCPNHIIKTTGKSLKWCAVCRKYLSFEWFREDITNADNLEQYCVSCMKEVDEYLSSSEKESFDNNLERDDPVRLECKFLDKNAKLPTRSRSTDAGYDISSVEKATIQAGKIAKISTGIALSTPPGFYYSIDGRSSLWMKGILPFRGIIDATYTGPLIVVLMNTSDSDYNVELGDRIAQIIVNRIVHCDIPVIEEFSPYYNQRGAAGFGSSGK